MKQAWTGYCAILAWNNGQPLFCNTQPLFYNKMAQWPVQAWHEEVFKLLKACKYSFESLVLINTVIYQYMDNQYMDNQKILNYHENCDVVMGANIHCFVLLFFLNRRSSGCTQFLFNVYGFLLQTRTSKFVFSSAENGFTRRRHL